jgi:hypothetical protein
MNAPKSWTTPADAGASWAWAAVLQTKLAIGTSIQVLAVRGDTRGRSLVSPRIYDTKKPKTRDKMVDDRKKVGRPPSDTEAINLRLPREVIEELDELRRKEADVPTRPEMIRRIIQEFLKATTQN